MCHEKLKHKRMHIDNKSDRQNCKNLEHNNV